MVAATSSGGGLEGPTCCFPTYMYIVLRTSLIFLCIYSNIIMVMNYNDNEYIYNSRFAQKRLFCAAANVVPHFPQLGIYNRGHGEGFDNQYPFPQE